MYHPDARLLFTFIRYFTTVLLLLSASCSLAFAIIKLIFVLRGSSLNTLYLSTVYIFLVFSTIEFIGMILMIPYLCRLKLLEQERSTVTKKQVDLKRLMTLAKSERLFIFLGSIFLLASSATQIVIPYYFGKIVDDALKFESMRSVSISVLILFGINCAGALASFFRSWLFALAGQ